MAPRDLYLKKGLKPLNKAALLRDQFKAEARQLCRTKTSYACPKYVESYAKQSAQQNMRKLLFNLNGIKR